MAKAVVDNVSNDRWQAAQKWERQHWIAAQQARAKYFKNYIWKALASIGFKSKYRGDDWNHWWKTRFNDYSFLPPAASNALEVGCGPYTNIRLMLDRCRIDHLFLSDPLIRTYVGFDLTFVSDMYKKAACMLDDHPLEELPFRDNYFDLVVMINVLDHVRSAAECMENIHRVTKPGGIVIVGQDLTNEADLQRNKAIEGDIGHPIRLDEEWFKPILAKGYEPIINKVLKQEEGRSGDTHYATLIFAAKKTAG